MPNNFVILNGKKFMWDCENYSSKGEAKEKMKEYENEGFEARLVEKDGQFFVYTRRVVTEIVIEEGGQTL